MTACCCLLLLYPKYVVSWAFSLDHFALGRALLRPEMPGPSGFNSIQHSLTHGLQSFEVVGATRPFVAFLPLAAGERA